MKYQRLDTFRLSTTLVLAFILASTGCDTSAKTSDKKSISLESSSSAVSLTQNLSYKPRLTARKLVKNPSTDAPPSPIRVTVRDASPWTYGDLWSPASPLRQPVSTLKSKGATVLPQTYMHDLWNQGLTNYGLTGGTASGMPIYFSKHSDPLLIVGCTKYGGKCNASGLEIHVNAHDLPQQCTGTCSDNHIIVIDKHAPKGPVEVDCWQTTISATALSCSWAGAYSLGTDGIHEPGNGGGSEGFHGGPAGSEILITGKELANGYINHALGMTAECLNEPTVYPADTTGKTDMPCNNSRTPPHYGNLVHLITPLSELHARGYSAPCMVVLAALQKYGAYLIDTGNLGLSFDAESEASYTSDPQTEAQNPWPQIQAQMNEAGDGNGTKWQDCLQRLTADDMELLQIKQP